MTNSQQLQKQPVIAQYLDRFKDQIAAALPRHLTPDRMSRIVMTEVRKVPKLLQCDPKSLFGAVIQASQVGLEPGSALGQCYLIPFGKDVQLVIGYRGMIDLARRSGQIVSIEARAVFEGDDFSHSFGLDPKLEHTPCPASQRGKLTHAYAVARLRGGGIQWDAMEREEIEAIRDASKGYISAKKYGKDSPWDDHFEEMAKKTVLRRLFKYLPVSIEIQTAVGLDEQADAGVSQQNDAVIVGEFSTIDDLDDGPGPSTKTEALKEKLSGAEDVDVETGEVIDGGASGPDADAVVAMIQAAKNSEALDAACDLIRDLDAAGTKRARAAATKKRKELEG